MGEFRKQQGSWISPERFKRNCLSTLDLQDGKHYSSRPASGGAEAECVREHCSRQRASEEGPVIPGSSLSPPSGCAARCLVHPPPPPPRGGYVCTRRADTRCCDLRRSCVLLLEIGTCPKSKVIFRQYSQHSELLFWRV